MSAVSILFLQGIHLIAVKLDNTFAPGLMQKNKDLFNDRYSDKGTTFAGDVMYYSGGSWISYGGSFTWPQAAYELSLALDNNDVPYIAYADPSNANKVTVKKYGGMFGWMNVGSPGFSDSDADMVKMAFDHNHVPYVLFKDYAHGQKATVMKYNSALYQWVSVGQAGFTTGVPSFPSLAIDDSDNLYVAYQNEDNYKKATVMRFNGSDWSVVGTPDFSAADVEFTSIAIVNNQPFLAYKDYSKWGEGFGSHL